MVHWESFCWQLKNSPRTGWMVASAWHVQCEENFTSLHRDFFMVQKLLRRHGTLALGFYQCHLRWSCKRSRRLPILKTWSVACRSHAKICNKLNYCNNCIQLSHRNLARVTKPFPLFLLPLSLPTVRCEYQRVWLHETNCCIFTHRVQ